MASRGVRRGIPFGGGHALRSRLRAFGVRQVRRDSRARRRSPRDAAYEDARASLSVALATANAVEPNGRHGSLGGGVGSVASDGIHDVIAVAY